MLRPVPALRRERLAAFLAFAALGAALFLYMKPWTFGGALNDDWAYLLPARRLAETGRLRLTDWASGTQVAQILWGAFWTKLFGWSPGILRCLTLLLALSSGLMLSFLLEGAAEPPAARLLAGFALVLNPIALPLAVSFMTDIPYLALLLGSLLAFRSALTDDRESSWAVGLFLAAAAYLVRQTGLLIPLAPTALLLLERRLTLRRAAQAWSIPAAALLSHAAWFHWAHGPTWASENYVWSATLARLANPAVFGAEALWRLFCLLAYAGLFCLPGSLGWTARRRTWRGWAAAGAFLAAGMAVWARRGGLPYLENLFAPSAVGTLTLSGAAFKPAGFLAARWFWMLATGMALAGGALLSRAALEPALDAGKERGPGRGPSALRAVGRGVSPAGRGAFLLAVCALFQVLASLLGAKYFDRYVLFFLPGAIALAFRGAWGKFRLAAGGAVLAAAAAVSIAGTADYLAWNKAKWDLGLKAVSAGLGPGRRPSALRALGKGVGPAGLRPPMIIAGFDWGGYWGYEPAMESLKKAKPLSRIGEWEWQSVFPAAAIMSWKPPERVPWRPVAAESYATPLSPRRGTIYLYAPGAPPPPAGEGRKRYNALRTGG